MLYSSRPPQVDSARLTLKGMKRVMAYQKDQLAENLVKLGELQTPILRQQ
jgi:hypothetical protein